jgi:S1-C subfamily serine protease
VLFTSTINQKGREASNPVGSSGVLLQSFQAWKDGLNALVLYEAVHSQGGGTVHLRLLDADREELQSADIDAADFQSADNYTWTFDRQGGELIQGSGFFTDCSHIATSRHVIAGAARIQVTLDKGESMAANGIVAEDPEGDLALVAVERRGHACEALPVRPAEPEVGQSVLVVGSPLGFDHSVSNGIVSAVRKVDGVGLVLQTTAPISHGSSGSPVLNEDGEVIGVVRSQREEGQNLNFATPADRVLALTPTKGESARLR